MQTEVVQGALENLLSHTMTAHMRSEMVDEIGPGKQFAPESTVKQDLAYVNESRHFLLSLGKNINEGLDMVAVIQEYGVDNLPERYAQRFEAWAEDVHTLKQRFEKNLVPEKPFLHREARQMHESLKTAIDPLTELDTQIKAALRPNLDLKTPAIDQREVITAPELVETPKVEAPKFPRL